MTQFERKKSITAYLDILGFKDAAAGDQSAEDELIKVLYLLNKQNTDGKN